MGFIDLPAQLAIKNKLGLEAGISDSAKEAVDCPAQLRSLGIW
jgi:hypothetical protein